MKITYKHTIKSMMKKKYKKLLFRCLFLTLYTLAVFLSLNMLNVFISTKYINYLKIFCFWKIVCPTWQTEPSFIVTKKTAKQR